MIIVTWQVDDGYAGGSRPQHTEIPDEDLDDCESEEEKQKIIDEYVQSDFEQMGWYIVNVEKR